MAVRSTLVLAIVLAAMLGQQPSGAAAHPLDEYLQAMYVTLSSSGITLELDLMPGVLVAPQVIDVIDANGDDVISEDEGRAYASAVLRDIVLEVDGQPHTHTHTLTLTKIELPTMLALTSGLGAIRLAATTVAGPNRPNSSIGLGSHQVFAQNTHAPIRSVYQSTVALDNAGGIQVSQQRRDELQQRFWVDYSISPSLGPSDSPSEEVSVRSNSGLTAQPQWLVDALYEPALAPSLLLIALALSAVLGGLHALTPGHGKTLLASYLVGSRGTVRHAVFLGGAVTFTHTASVIAMGALVLLAGHLIVPDLLVPALEVGSGLLVILLGARLVLLRWRAFRHGHDHDHARVHNHADAHPTDAVRWRELAAMGFSGGLIPCPEAIGILLVAVGLNRVALGMGLIVAFSVGLAIVLSVLGLLLVRSRGLVDHLGAAGQKTQRFLPLGSAVVVAVLGLGICLKGALAYLS